MNFKLFLLSEEFGTIQIDGTSGKKLIGMGHIILLSCCNFMRLNPCHRPQRGTKNLGKGQSVRINSEG